MFSLHLFSTRATNFATLDAYAGRTIGSTPVSRFSMTSRGVFFLFCLASVRVSRATSHLRNRELRKTNEKRLKFERDTRILRVGCALLDEDENFRLLVLYLPLPGQRRLAARGYPHNMATPLCSSGWGETLT